jgi:hypothetical protein
LLHQWLPDCQNRTSFLVSGTTITLEGSFMAWPHNDKSRSSSVIFKPIKDLNHCLHCQ